MEKETRFPRLVLALLVFLGVVVGGAVLHAVSSVVLPIVFAILFSFVLEPIVVTLHRRFRLPWVLGILIVIVICLVVIWAFLALFVSSLRTIIAVYPRYETRFMIIYQTIAGILRLPFDADISLFGNLWSQLGIRSFLQTTALSFSSSGLTLAKNIFLVILLIIFFLVEFRSFQKKIIFAVARAQRKQLMGIINDVIQQVTKYISVKFFISLLTGVLVYIGVLAIGLDFPIIWGFLAFLLNFIPNFGSIFAGVLTTLFALLQFWPEPGRVIITGVIMLGVNQILGNFIEPRVQGRNLGLSPFLILVSLSIWGWIWGFVGMILAVPMMVILKIVCENISFLRPLSVLMGSAASVTKEKHSNA